MYFLFPKRWFRGEKRVKREPGTGSQPQTEITPFEFYVYGYVYLYIVGMSSSSSSSALALALAPIKIPQQLMTLFFGKCIYKIAPKVAIKSRHFGSGSA